MGCGRLLVLKQQVLVSGGAAVNLPCLILTETFHFIFCCHHEYFMNYQFVELSLYSESSLLYVGTLTLGLSTLFF